MLITISNLYPRPDQPTRGMFNAQLFGEMAVAIGIQNPESRIQNVCLVPSWKLWQWSAIRRWKAPGQGKGGILPQRHGDTEGGEEEKENVLRSFQMAGTPFEKIAKHLSGGIPGERGDVQQSKPLLPLFSSLKKRCGNFGHGTPWAKYPQHWFSLLLSSRCLRASVVKSSLSSLGVSGQVATVYLPVFYLPVVGRSVNDVFYASALRKWAKTIKPGDVVYSPWLYPDGVAVERVLRGRGARVWLMALGSDTLRLQEARCRRKIVEACSAAEGIVCVAQVLADRLAAAGVPREKLHVVPNGVDTSLFHPRSKEAAASSPSPLGGEGGGEGFSDNGTNKPGNPSSLSLNELETPHLNPLPQGERKSGALTILFIGNLVPVKGPDVLLKAFSKIFEQKLAKPAKEENCFSAGGGDKNPPSRTSRASVQSLSSPRLIVIGSGPLRAKLERLARDLGISGRVHFLGNRSHLEVARWMNVADVLCLASRNEGMPNVVLEARASGLPVVATPAGAIPELPLDKEHFLVVKSCSPEDLAAGLQEMFGRDLSNRKPDPAISTWGGMAERVLALMQEKASLNV